MAFNPDFMNNPLTHIGIGILANRGLLGQGLQSSLGTFQQQQGVMNQQQLMKMRMDAFKQQQAQQAQAQQAQEAQRAAQQQLMGNDPQMGLLARAYPEAARKMMVEKLMPTQQKPISLSPGTTLYDPSKGQPIYTAPTAPKDRKIIKGADGFQYYADSGKRVLPGTTAPISPDNFKHAEKLRKEYTAVTDEFAKVNDSYARVEASVEEPSAAGDLALIFNYMKMLDPGSVVRESEFANAAASGAFGERIKAAAGKIATGERLSPSMRADFAGRAKRLYNKAATGYSKRKNEFTRLAKRFKLDPQDVIFERQLFQEQQIAPQGGQPLAPQGNVVNWEDM